MARPDPFEVALRDWSAQERIIASARLLTRAHGIDPDDD